MDEEKVIKYLQKETSAAAELFVFNIEKQRTMGNLIINLLSKAENGDFHKTKKS